MTLQQTETDPAVECLNTSTAKARRLADVSVLTWRRHDAALSPIIGKAGFAALYRHCVALQGKANPWLAIAHEGVSDTDDFAALHVALGRCAGRQAAVAQGALMKSFHEVLAALIGKPLVREALHSGWHTMTPDEAPR